MNINNDNYDKRKVVIIGTGFVGMSYAYALLNQKACDEIVLIDVDKKRAEGEAMDLNHGLAFSGTNMRISSGDYNECADADIVAISAGASQRPDESRIDLLHRNTEIFESIINNTVNSGFNGIFLIASNPVDVMSYVTYRISKFHHSRVIGTGTILDTARLRYLLGDYFKVDARNIHAYVMGEHGDSEFVPWTQAMIGTKSILTLCGDEPKKYDYSDLVNISDEVRLAAGKIIKAKKATYYGIGMAMVRITRAIFGHENSILTVSTLLEGEYGQRDVYAGIPCIVGGNGVRETLRLCLNDYELKQFNASCNFLRQVNSETDTITV